MTKKALIFKWCLLGIGLQVAVEWQGDPPKNHRTHRWPATYHSEYTQKGQYDEGTREYCRYTTKKCCSYQLKCLQPTA